jgi:prevent-host-death family protein
MKTMNVSEFRARALQVVDNLPKDGVVLTKRGKPIARIVPITEDPVDNTPLYGALKGILKIKGDIMSTGDRWDAES